ncbi:acetate/propionate family kinase [Enterobacteriaceae endosymbiont of Donacia bicoloricornis]|uniref:acetate kinase n=1 Tax=Enterobacteriaceae endosymbiont of Donacia bicoloricornis TaxID=2675772 RepID=UPI00144A14D8|nr:acetate kinase [Enterobacteriaceae endosymbiont of Donacia bicoloricornis]QJC37608.1 acetate/propionate family kinase [Enterobacteriaceae endosymbiont of Donacia bicoloricornis]
MLNKLILVINCGSSSLKFSIINILEKKILLFGLAENFNKKYSCITWNFNNIKKKKIFYSKIDHKIILNFIINVLLKENLLYNNIIAVGHRIVHGGEKFINSVVITKKVLKAIKNASIFAPLHNPIQLIGIQEIIKILPHLEGKQVAVFDTAFHQTIPEKAYLYALPIKFYKKYKIRRYGAHGTSYRYVIKIASKILNVSLNTLNCISCHLGNGSSITAIKNGKSVDTSMGLTPLEGLVMGTRCGDIDPAIIFYMFNILNLKINEIYKILTEKSGMLGLTNITSDFRYIENNYFKDLKIKKATDVFIHRLSKYIASYSILMEKKIDAIIFTGGIGENSVLIREKTIEKLKILNIFVDKKLNNEIKFGKTGFINTINSIPILVIPTNEELMIAQDTFNIITNK